MKNHFYWHWVGATTIVYLLGLWAGYDDGWNWWIFAAALVVGGLSRVLFLHAVNSAYLRGFDDAVTAFTEGVEALEK